MAYYPGQEGGHALADILFGDVNPSGRLPFTVPVSESDLVGFDHQSDAVSYGYFHGYRHAANQAITPRFAFGFGLGYTTFSYDSLTVSGNAESAVASVAVTNTGATAGDEVVQIYVGYPGSAVPRPVAELKGFARVTLAAGESTSVEIPLDDLSYHDGSAWLVESIGYTVFAGPNAGDLPLSQALAAP
jgi:beta-glucosidase